MKESKAKKKINNKVFHAAQRAKQALRALLIL